MDLTKLINPLIQAGKFVWSRGKKKKQFEEALAYAVLQAGNAAPAHRENFASPLFVEQDLRPIVRRAIKQPTKPFTAEHVATLYRQRFPLATTPAHTLVRADADTMILARIFVTAAMEKLLAASEWADRADRRQNAVALQRVSRLAYDIPPVDWPTAALMSRRWLALAFGSQAEARARLGQPIQINAPDLKLRVARPRFENAIRTALEAYDDVPVVVVGEDGVGKSWSAARALVERRADNDILLFISSRELDPSLDLEDLLATVLAGRAGMGTSEGWRELLELWIPQNDRPPLAERLIVVLDGLNENASARWRDLLSQAQQHRWRGRLKLVITARPTLAAEVLQQLAAWKVTPVQVPVQGFDDGELQDALTQVGRPHLMQQLGGGALEALLRTPRYFEVASRLWDEFEGDQDVTINRLILEDLRTQVAFNANRLDAAAWESLLSDLGARWLGGHRSVPLGEVKAALSAQALAEDKIETGLAQIRDGKLFPTNGPNRIGLDEALAPLAIGMAVIEHIRLMGFFSAIEVFDLVEALLPNLGTDQRAHALASASAIALCWAPTVSHPTELRAGLLAAWLCSQNLAADAETELKAYVVADPAAYADAFDCLAYRAPSNRLAVHLLEVALRHGAHSPAVQTLAVARAPDWAGYVGLDDPVHLGSGAPGPNPGPRSRRLLQTLGAIPGTGRQTIMTADLSFRPGEDRPFLLQLSAVMLRQQPLAPALKVFVNAAVAMAVSYSHEGTEKLRWTARLNRIDPEALDAAIRQAADAIALSDPARIITAQAAAAYLLNFIGDDADQDRIDRLDRLDQLDNPQLYASYLADPAASYVALEHRHVEMVSKAKVALHNQLDRLKGWMWDPTAKFSPRLTKRLAGLTARYWPAAEIGKHMSTTPMEVTFKEWEPVLARLDPAQLSAWLASFAQDVVQRTATPLRFGAEVLRRRLGALATPELDALQALLTARAVLAGQDAENQHINRILFDVLGWRLSATEQLDVILSPGCNGVHPRTESLLKPGDVAAIEARLSATNPDQRVELFAYLSMVELSTTVPILRALLAGAVNADTHAAAMALAALARHGGADAAQTLVDHDWRWRAGDEQYSHAGSLVLIRCGKAMSFDDLIDRIAPWLLPLAVRERGNVPSEIEAAAKVLETALMGDHSAPSLQDVAVLTVIQAANQAEIPALQVRLPTHKHQNPDDLALLLDGNRRREALEAAADRAAELIRTAHQQGALLFGRLFDPDLLTPFSDALERWARDLLSGGEIDANVRRHAAGFLIAAAGVLLRERPELGVALWKAIAQEPTEAGFKDADGASLALKVVFAAPSSLPRDALLLEIWDLDRAWTDEAIFDLVFAAESAGAREALDGLVAQDRASPRPYRRARAMMASSFRIDAPVPQSVRDESQMTWLWLPKIRQLCAERAARNAAAREHFRTFLSERDDGRAIAAWRLMLTCVDRRFRLWWQTELSAAGALSPQRQAHLDLNLDEVVKAFAANEKDLGKQFLSQKR